jgi:hypothetical protein
MSRKLIAALALCSVFIGGTALAMDHGHYPPRHTIHIFHGRRHNPFTGPAHHVVMVHHYHHSTGRRSHGH